MRMIPVLALIAATFAVPAIAQDVPKPVKLMTLQSGPAHIERQFFGQVVAKQTVDLAFQVGGQLQQLTAPEGQMIREGEVIAQLDLRAYTRARDQAKVNLDKARRDLERLTALRGSTVSDVTIRDAQTQVDLAQIALQNAEDSLDDATLRAPFDALVARREVANYTTVAAGTPIVLLHDVSELRVEIEVPEVLFRTAGRTGDVTFSAEFPDGDTRFNLSPREFEAEASAVGQTYTLTLAFDKNPGAFVYPGASLTVYAATELGGGDAVFLPETALSFDPEGKPRVMVFADGTVRSTPITMQITDDGRIQMTEGPATGTELVLTGASQLQDGQTVRRFTRIGE